MNDSMKETIDSLNNLLSRNLDAAEGFVEVANNVNYVNLTQWLIEWAKAHNSYALELKKLIVKLGGEVTSDSTTLLGELHHAWVDLKAQWTNNDTETLLEECLRGELTALKDYAEVSASNVMPDYARDLLTHQHSEIRRAIKSLEFMKKTYAQMEEATE